MNSDMINTYSILLEPPSMSFVCNPYWSPNCICRQDAGDKQDALKMPPVGRWSRALQLTERSELGNRAMLQHSVSYTATDRLIQQFAIIRRISPCVWHFIKIKHTKWMSPAFWHNLYSLEIIQGDFFNMFRFLCCFEGKQANAVCESGGCCREPRQQFAGFRGFHFMVSLSPSFMTCHLYAFACNSHTRSFPRARIQRRHLNQGQQALWAKANAHFPTWKLALRPQRWGRRRVHSLDLRCSRCPKLLQRCSEVKDLNDAKLSWGCPLHCRSDSGCSANSWWFRLPGVGFWSPNETTALETENVL